MTGRRFLVGTAGWSLPSIDQPHFPKEGTHLERYASVFPAVEINSSFYRPHRMATYERWRDTVPEDFRFSVKLPKEITHERRLADDGPALSKFLSEVNGLGYKLGSLLVQLPPSLPFNAKMAGDFFHLLRSQTIVPIACEPRHRTWFTIAAEDLLSNHRISRVAADPAIVPEASRPAAFPGLTYHRLHGSPHMYYSEYSSSYLERLSHELNFGRGDAQAWIIFDNTARGAAMVNARALLESLGL